MVTDRGPRGIKGPRGDTGLTGPPGPVGPRGFVGSDPEAESTPRSRWHRWTKTLASYAVAIVLMAGAIFLVGKAYTNLTTSPVVVVPATPAPFNPIRLLKLQVDPNVITVGKEASLVNGVCNDTPEDVVVRFYLGAVEQGANPLIGATTVDLVGKPTEEGRVRRSIPPGCSPERVTGIVPELLTPGFWKLTATIVVTGSAGELQIITDNSDTFEVLAATPLPQEAQ